MTVHLEPDAQGLLVSCPACGRRNRLRYERLGQRTRCGACQGELPHADAPVDVGAATLFDAIVRSSRLPVLVDFWAAWCGPCRMVAPQIADVARRSAGRLLVVKVDTDAVQDLAARLGIRSIPTLAVFAQGREAGRTAGTMTADGIERFVTQSVPHGAAESR